MTWLKDFAFWLVACLSLHATTTLVNAAAIDADQAAGKVDGATGKQSLTDCVADPASPMAPFCLPKNNTAWIVEDTYSVSWDVDMLSKNFSSVVVHLDHTNITGDSGSTVFTSEITDNSFGYLKIQPSKKWLKNKQPTEASVSLIANPKQGSGVRARTFDGPTIVLTRPPKKARPPSVYHTSPNRTAVLVIFPILAFVIFLFSTIMFFGMRRAGSFDSRGLRARLQPRSGAKMSYLGRKRKGGYRQLRGEELGDNENGDFMYSDNYRSGGFDSNGAIGKAERERQRRMNEARAGAFSQNMPLKTWTSKE